MIPEEFRRRVDRNLALFVERFGSQGFGRNVDRTTSPIETDGGLVFARRVLPQWLRSKVGGALGQLSARQPRRASNNYST